MTDYIIIGAGSAGCAMAARLSEDPHSSVIIVEHGGSDYGPFIQMPAALSYPMNMRRYDWGYKSAPEPHLGGRELVCPRGKVVGGSSAINGMVYVRGHALDFDHWRDSGASGWGYADVLPYYKRLETAIGGEAGWRGEDGPLRTTRSPGLNPLCEAFIQAGAQAGYAITRDYNGARQEGFDRMERTIWKGRRWSAAQAYLRPALKRPNLRLVRGLARKVVFEGKRAVGVEIRRKGRIEILKAGREVIIAASAINSPTLLMHSGVGPATDLRTLGIKVVADRPGVGGNLQDHLELYVQQECLQPITLYKHMNWPAKLWAGAQWMTLKRGVGASNHFEAVGFIRSRAGIDYPDIQFHFLPVAARYDGKSAIRGHGYQAHVGPMRSKSRGRVSLNSPDPEAPPHIRFNYMSHEEDWLEFRRAIRLTREIFAQDAFSPYRGAEIAPGAQAQDDAALDAYIIEHAESAYHPCGSCKMGAAADPQAVVDPECRVIGVEGLRVADSSIFPRIPNGNLNAPSIMTGEKAADLVLGRAPLPPENAEPWIHPEWETRQR